MPVIARFYGLIIKMFFQQQEHNPPHFHAVYGEYVGAIDIRTLERLEGDLPPKALALVREWAAQYTGGYGVSWNDDLDLACDALYHNGRERGGGIGV